MIGKRISSFEPSKRLESSSSDSLGEDGLLEKRGKRRCSRRRDAAGSAAVRVRERNRGLSTTRAVVRASRRMAIELSSLLYRW
jgi:hypothetical protein